MPIDGNGALTHVDTWAGRGGFGTRLLRDHNIAAVIYGGTVVDEDFRDRKVADEWFQVRFQKRLAAKDFEATTKYRFDPKLATGGTLGVNFSTLGGAMLSFNYRSIYMSEAERVALHQRSSSTTTSSSSTRRRSRPSSSTPAASRARPCARRCAASSRRTTSPTRRWGRSAGSSTSGPPRRWRTTPTRSASTRISAGGVLSWLMECLHEGVLLAGRRRRRRRRPSSRRTASASSRTRRTTPSSASRCSTRSSSERFDLAQGPRRRARRLARVKGRKVLDLFVHTAFARKGWMVPNQYWTPGALAPMPIMGKYYMYYGPDFLRAAPARPPERRADGAGTAARQPGHLPVPPRVGRGDGRRRSCEALYGLGQEFVEKVKMTASRINSRNSSVFWEAGRNADLVYEFLKRRRDVGERAAPGARRVDRAVRGGPARSGARLLVRDAQGRARVAAGILEDPDFGAR